MEQLTRIEARLESLSELGDLVGALRSMAASRLREAQEALDGTRVFRAVVERAVGEIAPIAAPPALPEARDRRQAGLLLVITPQNGFAGGFNERLAELALAERRQEERLIVVGRRGEIALAERGVTPDQAHAMTSRAAGVTQLARRISLRLDGLSSARIVHAHHAGGAGYEPQLQQVLPLSRQDTAPGGDVPLHHLPVPRLMRALASEFVFAAVADALMDSLVSENAARLRTMDAASRNISDKLDRLRRAAHVARQEEMTADMLDVVTGAEAIFNG
ncbi:F0F1 ATP synthase subunit gamma [Jannaschia seohaensis]|uniref:F-type H+-transporting ATPase subunit gamma n=1 Tax=Jannaschia seohaensis TaxID=475081 RepID=A0A2Y9AJF0_9RHOB|nr:F0F1 ATP synthase subunit gamma [Jannaschia seohaensis]PWJ20256.1 F-type H+-transporting ATPase subunit gamma [Jannaschia seohaensis]SSA44265.1 F-type H+-transporting ATPase subunit gamma [Jannaschia seohaensis]